MGNEKYLIALLTALLAPEIVNAAVTLYGYVFPSKNNVPAESVIIYNRGQKYGTGVNQNGFWIKTVGNYIANDSSSVKAITQAKDTVAEEFYRGPANDTKSLPTLFVDGHGGDIRRVHANDSVFGKSWIVGYNDTTFGKFDSSTTIRYIAAFDLTKLPNFQLGRQFGITLRLRDSAYTATGNIAGAFIDADTLPDATLGELPGFRNVKWKRIAVIPETVAVGQPCSRNGTIVNESDLREENGLSVFAKRVLRGQTLDSALVTGINLKPHPWSPDTARITFSNFVPTLADTGLNHLIYGINLNDSVPGDNAETLNVFVGYYDAAAYAIDAPVDTIWLDPIHPVVRIANAGTLKLDSMSVIDSIQKNGNPIYARDTVLRNILPGQIISVTFPLWMPQDTGNYTTTLRLYAPQEQGFFAYNNSTNSGLEREVRRLLGSERLRAFEDITRKVGPNSFFSIGYNVVNEQGETAYTQTVQVNTDAHGNAIMTDLLKNPVLLELLFGPSDNPASLQAQGRWLAEHTPYSQISPQSPQEIIQHNLRTKDIKQPNLADPYVKPDSAELRKKIYDAVRGRK